jgi:hypothetical protein
MILSNLAETIQSSSKDNEYIINNQKYIIDLVFVSPDGSVLSLSKNNVKVLNINDNVFNPFNVSSISFTDKDNSFQRLKVDKTETEFEPQLDILNGYNYRGDGRDFLFIQIIPVENENNPYGVQTDDYNKVFGYRNLFVCVDDNTNIDNGEEIKTFNLIDFDEKILQERKSFFSSSKLIEAEKPITQLSNKEREVETGKCIKKLLKDSLLSKSDEQIVETVDNLTPNFEDGISKLFYTSPANNSSLDDLFYLYKKHVSDNSVNDFSLLKKENFTNKYTLLGVNNLFKNAYNSDDSAGLYNLEKIVITGSGDSESLIENTKKTPTTIASFGEFSEVKNIKFFNTDSLLNSEKLVTKALHSYNFDQKEFNIEKENTDIVNVRKVYDANYVEHMKGDKNKPFPNFLVNQSKSINLSFENDFSLYGESREMRIGEGLNSLLKSSLVSNLAVEITLKGQLFRKTGRFISLDREGRYVDNLFDDKFLGIYFIVDVNHAFIGDKNYNNKILAVKTYIFKDPKFKEDLL